MAKKEKKPKKHAQKAVLPASVLYGVAAFIIVVVAALVALSKPRNITVVRDPLDGRMIEWIKSQGGEIPDYLSIKDGKYGRGIFTEKAVKFGDRLYALPEAVWFSEHNVASKKSKFYPITKDKRYKNLMEHHNMKLAVALEAERNNPNSFWKPYIDTLPTEFEGQPLFWEDDKVLLMQSRNVIQQIANSKSWLTTQYTQIMQKLIKDYPELFSAEANTFEMFKRAYYLVLSRVFDVGDPTDANDHMFALLPFVDLVNHPSEKKVENNNALEKVLPANVYYYLVKAYENLGAGSEVLQEYKDFNTCMKYLHNYGFLPGDMTDTSKDFIWIKGGSLPETSPLRLVGGDGLVQASFIESLGPDGFGILSKAVETALSSYDTTLDEDREQFKTNTDTVLYISLNIRIRFKQIFTRMLQGLREQKMTTVHHPQDVVSGNTIEILELEL
eukprot:m.24706 g.24706  ORF g.24706 m.24706 type:complete len:443 (-) comp7633_c0_seq1:913-2241(-)